MKTLIAISVITAFFATVVICCCVIKDRLVPVQKASCSHCAGKSQPSPMGEECCFSKAIPMELAKIFTMPTLLPILVLVFVHFLYLRPTRRLALRSIYANGPPGRARAVPLYIQSRSIRI